MVPDRDDPAGGPVVAERPDFESETGGPRWAARLESLDIKVARGDQPLWPLGWAFGALGCFAAEVW